MAPPQSKKRTRAVEAFESSFAHREQQDETSSLGNDRHDETPMKKRRKGTTTQAQARQNNRAIGDTQTFSGQNSQGPGVTSLSSEADDPPKAERRKSETWRAKVLRQSKRMKKELALDGAREKQEDAEKADLTASTEQLVAETHLHLAESEKLVTTKASDSRKRTSALAELHDISSSDDETQHNTGQDKRLSYTPYVKKQKHTEKTKSRTNNVPILKSRVASKDVTTSKTKQVLKQKVIRLKVSIPEARVDSLTSNSTKRSSLAPAPSSSYFPTQQLKATPRVEPLKANELTGRFTEDKKKILASLLDPEMLSVLHHIGTRRIGMTEISAIYELLCSMTTENDVQDAIFYLETHRWDLDTAKLEYFEDEKDRSLALQRNDSDELMSSTKKPLESQLADYNASLDRTPAFPSCNGEPFDSSKLRIPIKLNNASGKKAEYKSYSYPRTDTFNAQDQSKLNDLNRWRRKIFREKVGLANEARHTKTKRLSTSTDGSEDSGLSKTETTIANADWHPLEETWTTSHYALHDLGSSPSSSSNASSSRPLPSYGTMAQSMSNVFLDRFLPGRVRLRTPVRAAGAISGHLIRKWIVPKGRGFVLEKERKGMNVGARHAVAQKEAKESRVQSWEAGLSAGDNVWPLEEGARGMVTARMEDFGEDDNDDSVGKEHDGEAGVDVASQGAEDDVHSGERIAGEAEDLSWNDASTRRLKWTPPAGALRGWDMFMILAEACADQEKVTAPPV